MGYLNPHNNFCWTQAMKFTLNQTYGLGGDVGYKIQRLLYTYTSLLGTCSHKFLIYCGSSDVEHKQFQSVILHSVCFLSYKIS